MEPIIVEMLFKSTADALWNAISREEELKKWYFNLQGYKPEIGDELQQGEQFFNFYFH